MKSLVAARARLFLVRIMAICSAFSRNILRKPSSLKIVGAQLGLMHPEKFSDHAELHNYAERHGLEYLWEGTQAFERRKRTLPPEQFEICEARTHRGMRKVLLFSKDILVAEWLRDKPRRDRLAAKRARLRAKNKAWTA